MQEMKQEIYIDLHYILYYVSISINTQILSRALEKSGELFAGFSSLPQKKHLHLAKLSYK